MRKAEAAQNAASGAAANAAHKHTHTIALIAPRTSCMAPPMHVQAIISHLGRVPKAFAVGILAHRGQELADARLHARQAAICLLRHILFTLCSHHHHEGERTATLSTHEESRAMQRTKRECVSVVRRRESGGSKNSACLGSGGRRERASEARSQPIGSRFGTSARQPKKG